MQKQLRQDGAVDMGTDESSFQAAARALQQRLVSATRAEMDFNRVDIENIYKP